MNSNTFRYILAIGWGLLITLLPFIVSSNLFFPFISGKNLFFRAIVEIMLVLWIASCFQDKQLRPRWGWILGIFAGFTVWVGIADSLGVNPLRSFWSNFERMEGYVTFLHLFALFLVSASTLTKDLWYKLIGWSVFISGITFIQGIVEHVKAPAVRIDGAFGNAIYFAAYALIHIFFALILAMKYRKYAIMWCLFAVANLVTIFYTGTRGALLGVAGGIIVASLLYAICEWKNKKVRTYSLGILGVVVLSIVGLAFAKDTNFIKSSPVLYRFGELAQYMIRFDVEGLMQDIGRARISIWEIAWESAKERPITGWGQENFIYAFSENYNPLIFDQEQWFDRTHNVFFDWLISAGFIGLFGYLGIFAAMLWYLWRKEGFELHERIILSGLIVAYFIHTFFVFDNITTYIYIMLVLALVHAVSTNKDIIEHKKQHKGHHVHNSAGLIIGGGVAALALAFAVNIPVIATGSNMIKGLVYSYGANNQPANDAMMLESQRYFEAALDGVSFAKAEIREQLVDTSFRVRTSAATTSTKIGYINMITDQMEKNLSENPNDARVTYFAAVYYNSLGDTPRSIDLLNRALELSPGKQTMMFLLADAYKRTGNIQMSVETYKKAYEADPSFIEPRLRYVDALVSSGNKAEAGILMEGIEDEALFEIKYVNLLMALDRYDIIVEILERELKQNPQNVQIKISLAAAYVENEQREEAIVLLQTIVNDIPESKTQIEFFISEIRAGRNPVQR